MNEETYAYDRRGNLSLITENGVLRYAYDPMGRLVKVERMGEAPDEMGHVFGIGDGYPDTRPLNELEKEQGVIRRPDASELGLLDRDDIMVSQFGRLNISNTDIAMLILAYWGDEHQSFTNYTGHKQSKYFQREGKR